MVHQGAFEVDDTHVATSQFRKQIPIDSLRVLENNILESTNGCPVRAYDDFSLGIFNLAIMPRSGFPIHFIVRWGIHTSYGS